MAAFDFITAPKILFGRGRLGEIGTILRGFGARALVVRGGNHLEQSGALDVLETACAGAGVTCCLFLVQGEPDCQMVEAALARAREERVDVVVGIGGGSAVDAAKAVAGLLGQDGSLMDYLEVVGKGYSLPSAGKPMVAVPTTAGTGTEVTKNAVLGVRDRGVKASLRSEWLIPKVALIDPALTDALPPLVTASTGLDALAQLIEPYVSVRAQPLTDVLALEGIRRVARSLRGAWAEGDRDARDDMAFAALLGGLCLANAGLGAVHGFAAPLGGAYPVPHGVACGVLLPWVWRANVAALRARKPGDEALARYQEVGAALSGGDRTSSGRDLEKGAEWLEAAVLDFALPRLRQYGVAERDVPAVVERAKRASSMKGNPIVLEDDELAECLLRAL